MRTLLIDADILVYKACAYAGTDVDWGDDGLMRTADKGKIMDYLGSQVLEMLHTLRANACDLFLSGADSRAWRQAILPGYKSGRLSDKPVGYLYARTHLQDLYGAEMVSNLEADDLLGLRATDPGYLPEEEKVIVSSDKDLRTIPGLLCQWPQSKKIERISVEEADYNHMFQTLMGDRVDGYPGCPDVGEKTARKFLNGLTLPGLWWNVCDAYDRAGCEDQALPNAQVSRILRHGEYNFETQEVTPWQGPSQ